MPYRSLLMALVCVFFVSGCATWENYFGYRNRIVGSWVFEDPGNGPLVLTFKRNRTFEVDGGGDGKKDIWGRYEIFENRVKFIDEKPRIITDCYEAGFHYYARAKGQLKFTRLADQCKPRRHILRFGFIKKPKP